jgi:hypothetical protein
LLPTAGKRGYIMVQPNISRSLKKILIKKESFPSHCDNCHQSDCFDPETNYCSRCAIETRIKKDNVNPINLVPSSINYLIIGATFGAVIGLIVGLIAEVPIVFLLIGTFIGLFVGYQKFLEVKRLYQLRLVAEDLGLEFIESPDISMINNFEEFHLFSQGHSKRISFLLNGKIDGIDVKIFEYKYTLGSGKSTTTYKKPVMWFGSNQSNFPSFSLRPESIFHKIGSLLGYQDINFSECPEFSSNYLLRGKDESKIRRTFNNAILSYFEKNRGISTECNGKNLICYLEQGNIEPNNIRSFIERGFSIYKLFTN